MVPPLETTARKRGKEERTIITSSFLFIPNIYFIYLKNIQIYFVYLKVHCLFLFKIYFFKFHSILLDICSFFLCDMIYFLVVQYIYLCTDFTTYFICKFLQPC